MNRGMGVGGRSGRSAQRLRGGGFRPLPQHGRAAPACCHPAPRPSGLQGLRRRHLLRLYQVNRTDTRC